MGRKVLLSREVVKSRGIEKRGDISLGAGDRGAGMVRASSAFNRELGIEELTWYVHSALSLD
jgi:hypothetical protein